VIFSGLQYLARELLARAEEELYDADKVHHEMTEAYAALESGAISEEEFDLREEQLMERLEAIEARRQAAARGDGDGDESDGDGDGDESDGDDDDDDDDDDGELEESEDDEEAGSEVHYGIFDDGDDKDGDVVQGSLQAEQPRRGS
jgi:hypothetical protein